MITLYGMSSHNVYKAAIMLEECGLPYRLEYVDVYAGQQFSPAFAKLNPNSKVPVIEDSEGPEGKPVVVFESGAILFYLAEKSGVLWPASMEARAGVLQWVFLQVGSVGPMIGQLNHFALYAPKGLNPYAHERYFTESHRVLNVLQTRLKESPYLAGDTYSIADIATFPRIKMLHTNVIRLEPERHPDLIRWVEDIDARPAVKRAMEAAAIFPKLDGANKDKADTAELDRLFGRGAAAQRILNARP